MLFNIDSNILIWIQENIRCSWLTPIMKGISLLGNAGIIWIAIAIILVCIKKTRKEGLYMAIGLVMSVIFCNLLLKNIVARTRPYEAIEQLVSLIGKVSDYSFPSGHTTASFISAIIIYKKFPKWIGIVTYVFAATMAFSRMYLGVHYFTDILGGIVLGTIIGLAAIKIYDILEKRLCSIIKH